jgi:hypothetical protein
MQEALKHRPKHCVLASKMSMVSRRVGRRAILLEVNMEVGMRDIQVACIASPVL